MIVNPLEVEDFTQELLHRLDDASKRDAVGLHVQLTVPRECAYEWLDEDLHSHTVHLPSMVRTTELHHNAAPTEDGGPAAVFTLHSGGMAPPPDAVREIAFEMYRQGVRWGRVHHTPWDHMPGDDIPMLPARFDRIVEAAVMSDAPV
ncbi:MAG: hypothetical protein JWM90_2633 [Thermoleophilia bacterium]|nr:hypothetical protein [Thermoleophilia bacterium]